MATERVTSLSATNGHSNKAFIIDITELKSVKDIAKEQGERDAVEQAKEAEVQAKKDKKLADKEKKRQRNEKVKNGWAHCCGSLRKVLGWFIFLAFLSFAITILLIGCIYFSECEEVENIPIYLIISGLLYTILSLVVFVKRCFKKEKMSSVEKGVVGFLTLFLSVYTFAVIYIFPRHDECKNKDFGTFAVVIYGITYAFSICFMSPYLCYYLLVEKL